MKHLPKTPAGNLRRLDKKVVAEVAAAKRAGPGASERLFRQTAWCGVSSKLVTIQNPQKEEQARCVQQGHLLLSAEPWPLRLGLILDGSRIGTYKTLVGELTFLRTGISTWAPSQNVRDGAWAVDHQWTPEAVETVVGHWRAGMRNFLQPLLEHWDKGADSSDDDAEPHGADQPQLPAEHGDRAEGQETGEQLVPAEAGGDSSAPAKHQASQKKKPLRKRGDRLMGPAKANRLRGICTYDLAAYIDNMLRGYGAGWANFKVEVPSLDLAY